MKTKGVFLGGEEENESKGEFFFLVYFPSFVKVCSK